jgi:hypothetical protein
LACRRTCARPCIWATSITGEVGQVRRAIVFHGDVMNTTGRLEQATREVGCFFIASAEALVPLVLPPENQRPRPWRAGTARASRGHPRVLHRTFGEHRPRALTSVSAHLRRESLL